MLQLERIQPGRQSLKVGLLRFYLFDARFQFGNPRILLFELRLQLRKLCLRLFELRRTFFQCLHRDY